MRYINWTHKGMKNNLGKVFEIFKRSTAQFKIIYNVIFCYFNRTFAMDHYKGPPIVRSAMLFRQQFLVTMEDLIYSTHQ